MKRRITIFSALVIATLWLAAPARPQGTDLGTIRGTVTDVTGAVIPKAAVEITDLSTNLSRKVAADSEGNYEAAGLAYGDYKVTVSVAGFANSEIAGTCVP